MTNSKHNDSVADAFDRIVDELNRQIVALKTWAAENLAREVDGETDKVISVADAAETLSKSRKTVLRYCKDGQLRGFVAPGMKLTTGVYLSSLKALLSA